MTPSSAVLYLPSLLARMVVRTTGKRNVPYRLFRRRRYLPPVSACHRPSPPPTAGAVPPYPPAYLHTTTRCAMAWRLYLRRAATAALRVPRAAAFCCAATPLHYRACGTPCHLPTCSPPVPHAYLPAHLLRRRLAPPTIFYLLPHLVFFLPLFAIPSWVGDNGSWCLPPAREHATSPSRSSTGWFYSASRCLLCACRAPLWTLHHVAGRLPFNTTAVPHKHLPLRRDDMVPAATTTSPCRAFNLFLCHSQPAIRHQVS